MKLFVVLSLLTFSRSVFAQTGLPTVDFTCKSIDAIKFGVNIDWYSGSQKTGTTREEGNDFISLSAHCIAEKQELYFKLPVGDSITFIVDTITRRISNLKIYCNVYHTSTNQGNYNDVDGYEEYVLTFKDIPYLGSMLDTILVDSDSLWCDYSCNVERAGDGRGFNYNGSSYDNGQIRTFLKLKIIAPAKTKLIIHSRFAAQDTIWLDSYIKRSGQHSLDTSISTFREILDDTLYVDGSNEFTGLVKVLYGKDRYPLTLKIYDDAFAQLTLSKHKSPAADEDSLYIATDSLPLHVVSPLRREVYLGIYPSFYDEYYHSYSDDSYSRLEFKRWGNGWTPDTLSLIIIYPEREAVANSPSVNTPLWITKDGVGNSVVHYSREISERELFVYNVLGMARRYVLNSEICTLGILSPGCYFARLGNEVAKFVVIE
jgi:hypothetical protein